MLWIRSQDRKKLIEVNRLDILEPHLVVDELIASNLKEKQKYANMYRITGNCIVLGYYSTKEKALNVLDNIMGELASYYCDLKGHKFTPPKVFEMPEDEEVD